MQNLLTIFEKFNNTNRGDEFYTNLSDIEKELKNYDISNKIVYCPCDNPEFSKFWEYLKTNFSKLKLKKLISTYYDENAKATIYDGSKLINEDISDNGDFTKQDKYFKQADIVITNPPFSNDYPEHLLNICLKYNLKFLFIGPLGFYTKNKVFELYKDNKFNLGYNAINSFYNKSAKLDAPCVWYTNLDIKKPIFKFNKKYDENKYSKFDNTNILNCPKYEDIPDEYYDEIGTSVRFALKLNREQFEVIDKIRPKLNGINKFLKLVIKRK